MATSDIALLAAFFIGLMTAISPCPLATNITAIAYISKRIDNSKHTLVVGFLYTFGRMFSYVLIASLIVWFGISTRIIAPSLQEYGEILLGPLLLIVGILMLGFVKFDFFGNSEKLSKLKERLATKGYIGSFLLGTLFALAFCPFSAVLFFGMLIPLALKAGSAILVPSVFAFATGLPVIIFSFILVYSISRLGQVMNKVQTFEKWMRRIVAIVFIVIGVYYILIMAIY